MKFVYTSLVCFLLLFSSAVFAGEASAAGQEKQFAELLTNVSLVGRWCLVRDGQLTPEREETYSVVGVQKADGDKWIVNAKLTYQGQSIVVPIPVRVQWVGGAAVMIVDNLAIPGGGTYSARVLFHGETYTGTWSGGDRVGMLHGVIKAGAGEQTR